MNKTFDDMKTNVGLELQDTSTSFKTLIGKWLNRRMFQVLRAINFDAINQGYYFNTVAGTQDYAMPRDFKDAVYVIDRTNGITYKEVRVDEYAEEPSVIFEQGATASYTLYNSPVTSQPSAAAVVTIVSSSASDAATTVTIYGMANGVETRETLTITGTTPVVGSVSFTYIKSITKDTTVGYITVTCESKTIALLNPELKVSRRKIMRMFPIPSSASAVYVPYHVNPMPMYDDNDTPCIDIDDCLEAGARADGWRYKRQGQKATIEDRIYETMLADYIFDLESNPNLRNDFKPVPYPRD